MLLFEFIFAFVVIIISLALPLLIYFKRIRIVSRLYICIIFLVLNSIGSLFLSFVGINLGGFIHSMFMKIGAPPLPIRYGEFFLHIYWMLIPCVVLVFSVSDTVLRKKSDIRNNAN